MSGIDVVVLGAEIVGAVAETALYFEERHDLKNGDVSIHNQADLEKELERLKIVPNNDLQHRLHPQHKLKFVQGDTPFVCKACKYEGTSNRYSCGDCDFDLHQACAISDEIMTGLMAEKTKLIPSVHEHSLTLESGLTYSCSHCNAENDTDYRYYCLQCNMKFDLICVAHPTHLPSFLHPQHDLELQTKHHFKKCAVCHHTGRSNARVYSCEDCEFYVHTNCVVRSQYVQEHPLHFVGHTLVFAAAQISALNVCTLCQKKCEHWCYLCSDCKDVYFHPECLYPEPSSPFKKIVEFSETVLEIFDE